MGRTKTIRALITSHSSTSGGGQRWAEVLVKNLPPSVKARVLFTRAGHPGNIFWHRLEPWLAPQPLHYNKSKADWPKKVAEFIDKEKVDVMVQEEDERLREIIEACRRKPRVVYVKHVMDPRGDIAANADIIDKVVCVSEKIGYGVPGSLVIRNGVPPPECSGIDVRSVFGIDPAAFVIGYMGRVDRNKNVELILRVAEKNNWKALIVGKPDYPIRKSPAAVVVPTDVYYTGDFYKAMNVFVLPSFQEGFPLAPMEALLSGTPVAMTPVSDYPQLFENAVAFFGAGNIAEADDAIKRVPPPEFGQTIIKESLCVKKMVSTYVDVFRGKA